MQILNSFFIGLNKPFVRVFLAAITQDTNFKQDDHLIYVIIYAGFLLLFALNSWRGRLWAQKVPVS